MLATGSRAAIGESRAAAGRENNCSCYGIWLMSFGSCRCSRSATAAAEARASDCCSRFPTRSPPVRFRSTMEHCAKSVRVCRWLSALANEVAIRLLCIASAHIGCRKPDTFDSAGRSVDRGRADVTHDISRAIFIVCAFRNPNTCRSGRTQSGSGWGGFVLLYFGERISTDERPAVKIAICEFGSLARFRSFDGELRSNWSLNRGLLLFFRRLVLSVQRLRSCTFSTLF